MSTGSEQLVAARPDDQLIKLRVVGADLAKVEVDGVSIDYRKQMAANNWPQAASGQGPATGFKHPT